jgi:hypothetical protein
MVDSSAAVQANASKSLAKDLNAWWMAIFWVKHPAERFVPLADRH